MNNAQVITLHQQVKTRKELEEEKMALIGGQYRIIALREENSKKTTIAHIYKDRETHEVSTHEVTLYV
jgi:hypothetical protein